MLFLAGAGVDTGAIVGNGGGDVGDDGSEDVTDDVLGKVSAVDGCCESKAVPSVALFVATLLEGSVALFLGALFSVAISSAKGLRT